MASGFTVASNEHLIRANIYSRDITRAFQDDLFAMRFVRTITGLSGWYDTKHSPIGYS